MEKMVVSALGVAFRMILRCWAKDNTLLNANILDIEQFAQQCGLTIWEAKKFNRSIESYIDVVAENFIKEYGSKIKNEKRKNVIIKQIQDDIESICISESRLIAEISNLEDLRNLIMKQSEKERKLWSDTEVGVYTNCVRYISKVSMDFISLLPSFTPEALKVVIQRQDEYYKKLYGILREIHSMASATKSAVVTYSEYENTYRERIVEKYSKVELIGASFNNARNITRYDISSAYVELSCVSEYENEYVIELSKVFTRNNVVWVKGEAGSGKTTFLQWVAICAAKNEYQKIDNIKNTVPIVIELRNAKWPISLNDAVNNVTAIYGNSCPNGWISDLLKKNRVILLFDGLDEINQIKRKETYNFVENIVEKYPQIKILLTARKSVKDCISCESADYEILPMKIGNIKKFINYWHRSVLRKDAIVGDKEIESLKNNLKQKIVENQPLKVLARNPLLCAMICALNYVKNQKLPEDKMELYEKCCELLIDTRDDYRNIGSEIYKNMPRLDYSKKRRILEDLSYWMMNGNVSSESKETVIKHLSNFFDNTNILPSKNNKHNTEIILTYLIERSGIIREPQEGVIDFIHKTFMEFLAVKEICRNCDWNVLIREACNVNWKETIIMCIQEMGKDNVNEVLRRLINQSKIENDDRYILMASLGVANTVFHVDDEIKKEIDNKIKLMIPPKMSDLSEIAQAGIYLLPFLEDSRKYSDSKRIRCLKLLNRIAMHETIPYIISYILGNGGEDVKKYAITILERNEISILEEYNVSEKLGDNLWNSIDGDTFTIYESLLYLIKSEDLSKPDMKKLEEVRCLRFIRGSWNNLDICGKILEILRYFKDCERVFIEGYVCPLNFFDQFTNIIDLVIKSSNDLSRLFNEFSQIGSLRGIKNLYIETAQLSYICEKDLKNLKNLENFELHCKDEKMELEFDNFNNFSKLKKVRLFVNRLLINEIEEKIPEWKESSDGLEIVCEAIA